MWPFVAILIGLSLTINSDSPTTSPLHNYILGAPPQDLFKFDKSFLSTESSYRHEIFCVGLEN